MRIRGVTQPLALEMCALLFFFIIAPFEDVYIITERERSKKEEAREQWLTWWKTAAVQPQKHTEPHGVASIFQHITVVRTHHAQLKPSRV